MEIKDSAHTFKTGELVSCDWGGKNKIGFIIDPVVRYNGYMKFTKANSENAAIVRFLLPSSTGYTYSKHEVVPYRVIDKIKEVEQGNVINVDRSYELTVEIIKGDHKGLTRKIYCNEKHEYSPGELVEVLHSKNNYSVDKFYVYNKWSKDESSRTKLTGYEK